VSEICLAQQPATAAALEEILGRPCTTRLCRLSAAHMLLFKEPNPADAVSVGDDRVLLAVGATSKCVIKSLALPVCSGLSATPFKECPLTKKLCKKRCAGSFGLCGKGSQRR